MAFVPRTHETILTDMIAHVRANTPLTDFTVGSVARTFLEACSLEDDEQYYQMVQILDDFSFNKATGTSLDERAADFNIYRLGTAAATGNVQFRDGSLATSLLTFNVSSGPSPVFLTVDDSSDFPVSYPYDVRVGEGTSSVETLTVSNNNTVTNVITVGVVVNSHAAGERVSLVSIPTKTIPIGTQVQVPASGDDLPIIYQTTEAATIDGGNYYSNVVNAKALEDGSDGNTGAGTVTQFAGSAPFTGALVTNATSMGGGRDRELDSEFRSRIKQKLNELARATISAIEGGVKGITDSVTGQQVASANLIEDFNTNEHLLYIDDGSGFTPDSVTMGRSTLTVLVGAPTSTLTLAGTSGFPALGTILVSPENPAQVEILEYTSKNDTTSQLSLSSPTTLTHDVSDEVLLVDLIGIAEEGQNYFRANYYPIKDNSFELYDDRGGGGVFALRTEGTDFFLNRTNGEIQYTGGGLPSGTKVYANYDYYTGLLAEAQKVVNGDRNDRSNYPGLGAGGVIINVAAPSIRTVTIILSITAETGLDEVDVRDKAKRAVEVYIDSRGVGENVILAEIVKRVMLINGVTNVTISYPLSDVVVLESEVPKSFDSNGTSLITVV